MVNRTEEDQIHILDKGAKQMIKRHRKNLARNKYLYLSSPGSL